MKGGIAPGALKESPSAGQAAETIEKGFRESYPQVAYSELAMDEGGLRCGASARA